MTTQTRTAGAGVRSGAETRAAGAVPWRLTGGGLQVALVHRPRYDDWSWAKGKLDAGESWPGAAVREVLEETGLHVRLGRPLPGARYQGTVDARPRDKQVHYWAAEVTGGAGELIHEVDDVAWLGPDDARARLTYQRDRSQLAAVEAAHRQGTLATWPLLLVRHATTVPRRDWTGPDTLRPLDLTGQQCADRLVPLLTAYAPQRLLTSEADRCVDTLRPLAAHTGRRLRQMHPLSEDGLTDTPGGALRVLRKVLRRGKSTVLCTHRPVLPTLIEALADRAVAPHLADALRESTGPGLLKGEVLIAHLHDTDDAAQVVAVERHDPRAS